MLTLCRRAGCLALARTRDSHDSHAFATIQHVTIDGKNKRTLACAAHSIGREWEGGIDDARAHQIWAVSPPGHVALPLLLNSTLARAALNSALAGPNGDPCSEYCNNHPNILFW